MILSLFSLSTKQNRILRQIEQPHEGTRKANLVVFFRAETLPVLLQESLACLVCVNPAVLDKRRVARAGKLQSSKKTALGLQNLERC